MRGATCGLQQHDVNSTCEFLFVFRASEKSLNLTVRCRHSVLKCVVVLHRSRHMRGVMTSCGGTVTSIARLVQSNQHNTHLNDIQMLH